MTTRSARPIEPDVAGLRAWFGGRGRPDRSTVVIVVTLIAAVAMGALAAVSPVLALGTVGAVAVLLLLSLGQRMIPLFHGVLLVVLVGLAFFGRGFAYVGVYPLFVSELTLGLALIAVLVSLPGARWRPVHLAIVLFMGWGVWRTIPYVGAYGIDALRDGVAYGYAIFAFAISLTVRREHIDALLPLYRRWFPLFLLWVPVAAVTASLFLAQLPTVPGSNVPVVVFKAGDAGVHLGAFGAFMLLGLGGANAGGIRDGFIWALWLIALAFSSIISRGGMVAASMMATSVIFARASANWLSLTLVGLLLVAIVGLANPQLDIGRSRRLSLDQAVANVMSIVGLGKDEGWLEITKEWRLAWWDKILDYTLAGQYFWPGKGFGINLADDDGFQVEADGSLRGPHSGHLMFLARGGVPMLALWILVQLAFVVTILRAALRAHAAALTRWVRILGWIFVYWLAALVNAAFDVYLEGPMGGVWYWSMIGLGIAVVGIVDEEIRAGARTKPPAASPPRVSRLPREAGAGS
jgi:hypothetical protein